MILGAYRGLTRLGSPLIDLYLRRRLRAGKEDATRFAERLGHASAARPQGRLIWIHGASVGEALSALPLIEALLKAHDGLHVLMTTGTVTSARLMDERLPERALHQFVPVDRPGDIGRFLDHWRPDMALWLESEIWPNLLSALRGRRIPALLINGRMSERSFRRWRRFPRSAARLLSVFAEGFAQTPQEAERFRALGLTACRFAGNLKYAAPPLPVDADALARFSAMTGDRPVWIAASTHPGEEARLAAAHAALLETLPAALLLLVPRHPERGGEVEKIVRRASLKCALRSTHAPVTGETQVYIGDSLGEMGLFYRLADIAFMGGSLIPHGGQNPLEPARLGLPILHGAHMFNHAGAIADLQLAGAAVEIADETALCRHLLDWFGDDAARRHAARAAEMAIAANDGCIDAIMDAVARHLPAAGEEGS